MVPASWELREKSAETDRSVVNLLGGGGDQALRTQVHRCGGLRNTNVADANVSLPTAMGGQTRPCQMTRSRMSPKEIVP
eukprot:ctg_2172.g359